MFKLKYIFSLSLVIILAACNANQQTIAYKSLAVTEQTVITAYSGYVSLVINGTISTNDVPKVSKIFNQVQSDLVLATVLAKNNTNALVPSNIVLEVEGLISAINAAKQLTK